VKCDCEEINGQVLSVCPLHGQLFEKYNAIGKLPHNQPARHSDDKALRAELLKAAMPALITRLQPNDDLETIAQRTTILIHELARRAD
jgi:hypothetical protein